MKRVLEGIIDLFFPRTCAFCGRVISENTGICGACRESLPFLSEDEKLPAPEFTEGCISALSYNREVIDAVHRFKFKGSWHYCRFFAGLTVPYAEAHWDEGFDTVTYVPGSHERSYNPAKLLAEELCKQLKLSPPENLLRKIRKNKRQSTLSAEARRANVLGVYDICPGAVLTGKRILLVDDVYTTGATLAECARMLLTYGAATVTCITLARAEMRK